MKTSTKTYYNGLIEKISELVNKSRIEVAKAINTKIANTYWAIGKYIVEYGQQGKIRADYGSELMKTLSRELSAKFGKGFSQRNLRDMRRMYILYPKWQTVSAELSWSNYCLLLSIEDKAKRRNLDIFYNQLSLFFVESYQEFIKDIFSAKQIKGSAKLVRKSNFASNLLTCDNHHNFMNIANKLCRSSLKNSLFPRFYIQTDKSANAAAKDGNTSTRVNYSRSIKIEIFNYSYWDYRIIRTPKQLVRKLHNILISSSFLGTFITITSSREIPFFLISAVTSDAESAEAIMPLSVMAIHLPLYFSVSSGCDDNHSSSFIFSTIEYIGKELYKPFAEGGEIA